MMASVCCVPTCAEIFPFYFSCRSQGADISILQDNCMEQDVSVWYPAYTTSGAGAVEASHSSLFENKPVVIVPHRNQRPGSQELVTDFWSNLSSICFELSAEEHDAILAKTSHLPHFLAYAFMSMLSRDDLHHSGGGLDDFTRIAGANPDMWWAIFSLNEPELSKAMDEFQQAFDKLREAISKRDQHAAFEIMNSAYNKRKHIWFDYWGKGNNDRWF